MWGLYQIADKIPTAATFNEIVEMDVVDYGDVWGLFFAYEVLFAIL